MHSSIATLVLKMHLADYGPAGQSAHIPGLLKSSNEGEENQNPEEIRYFRAMGRG